MSTPCQCGSLLLGQCAKQCGSCTSQHAGCALALQVMALGHPVIVVQCPGVSMRLGPVLPVDEVVDQVVGVLDKLGVEQACVIGHSYGKGPPVAAV